MAEPTAEDVFWRPGTNGVATNDTSPILGAVNNLATLTPGADGQMIATGEAAVIGGSNRVHYGGGYIELDEGAEGSLVGSYLSLANGGVKTPAQGSIIVTDPTGANHNLEIIVCGIVLGSPVRGELQFDGVGGSSVSTAAVFDDDSHWWIQTKDNAAIAGTDGTDDLSVKVGAAEIAIMRAPHADYPNGCRCVSSIYSIAAATAANEALTSANRLTAPTATSGVSAYVSGAETADTDERLSLGTLADGTYRGIALRRTIPPGMPMPPAGAVHIFVLDGTATA